MKRLFGTTALVVALGFVLGCNATLDYSEDEGQKDGLAKNQMVPATPIKPFGGHVDAVLPYLHNPYLIQARNEQKPYFFNGGNYNWLKFKVGTTADDYLITWTTAISEGWSSLARAGFDRVDAIIPVTKNKSANAAYFFKDDKYMKIRYEYGKWNDTVLVWPRKIVDNWPSIREAGFDRVDAAFTYEILYGRTRAYIFSGDSYIKILIDRNNNDSLIARPTKIADGWPVLAKAGFDRVDAVLTINGYPSDSYPYHRAYFFSGDRYLLMKFSPTGGQEIMGGPSKITDGWPLLR